MLTYICVCVCLLSLYSVRAASTAKRCELSLCGSWQEETLGDLPPRSTYSLRLELQVLTHPLVTPQSRWLRNIYLRPQLTLEWKLPPDPAPQINPLHWVTRKGVHVIDPVCPRVHGPLLNPTIPFILQIMWRRLCRLRRLAKRRAKRAEPGNPILYTELGTEPGIATRTVAGTIGRWSNSKVPERRRLLRTPIRGELLDSGLCRK